MFTPKFRFAQLARVVGSSVLLGALVLAPADMALAKDELTAKAIKLEKSFARPDQTLEYHFMLKAPAFTDETRNQVLAGLMEALKPVGEVGKLKSPKTGAYLDSKDRALDKARLILRLRPGLVTVKARATSLNELIDLEPCKVIKYENDFLDEVGYSISSEYPFKAEEWLVDPTKASVKQTLEFLLEKCPALGKQLEGYLKPIESLTAPGTANMYSAEFKFAQALPMELKETGFAAWTFPGTKASLAEVAWTGYVKDKAALDQLYSETRAKLQKAGVLADDQSSKTEQYFNAYYGARPAATK